MDEVTAGAPVAKRRPSPKPETEIEPNSLRLDAAPQSTEGAVVLPRDDAVGVRLDEPIPALDTRQVFRRSAYASAQLNLLVMKYAQIRSDLYVSLPHCPRSREEYAERIRDYLQDAKNELESRHSPNLLVTASLLSAADTLLVWLYTTPIVVQRTTTTLARLQVANRETEYLNLMDSLDSFRADPTDFGTEPLRTALEASLRTLHDLDRDGLVEEDLQVRRLKILIVSLGIAFVLLIAAIPFTTDVILNANEYVVWPIVRGEFHRIDLIISAVALAAVGAAGGVISGMLNIRDSRASLLSYRASLLNLALKPIIGAVAALVLYIFLSWNMIKGLEVTNPGIFLVSAFLAGFSERYFLRTIRVAGNESAASSSKGTTPSGAPGGSPESSKTVGSI